MATLKERLDSYGKGGDTRSLAERLQSYKTAGRDSIVNRLDKWFTNNNIFVSNYQKRTAGTTGSYDDKYDSETSSWLQTVTNQKSNFDTEANSIKSYLEANRDEFDSEWLKNTLSALSEAQKYQDNILAGTKSLNDYWTQWDSEDSYNKWVTNMKDREAKLNYDLRAGAADISRLETIQSNASAIMKRITELENTLEERRKYAMRMGTTTLIDSSKEEAELSALKAEYESKYKNIDLNSLSAEINDKKAYYTLAERLQSAEALINNAMTAPNFETYAAKGAAIENPTPEEAESGIYIFGNKVGKKVEVGNIVTYSRDNYEAMAQGEIMGGGSEYGKSIYHYMTEDEVKVYNYYLGKGDKETAQKFLDSIEDSLNERHGSQMYEAMEGKTGLELVFGVAAGLDQFYSGVSSLFNNSDYIPTSSVQYASGMVREDLADNGANILGSSLGQIGYDLITTTTNMLPSILVGGAAGTALLGATAAGNAKAEMLRLGYDKNQATAYGLLVGASEGLLEYAFSGISRLGGKVWEALGKSGIASMVDNILGNISVKAPGVVIALGKTLGGAAGEAFEEGLQSILEPWFKNFVVGGNLESPNWAEVAYSSLLGALSAGVLESVGNAANVSSVSRVGNKINKAQGISRLVELGQTYSADTVAYKLAGKINNAIKNGGKVNAYSIGQLFIEEGATLSAQNISDLTRGLEELGWDSKSAATMANAYAELLEGTIDMTDDVRMIFSENQPLTQALIKKLINENTTVLQRTKGYAELDSLVNKKATSKKETVAAKPTLTEDEETAPARDAVDRVYKALNVKGEYSYSEGKGVTVKSTGEAAEVADVVSTKDGNLKVKLTDGKTLDAKELNFRSEGEALVYETVANLGVDAATAWSIIKNYDPNGKQRGDEYALGALEAFRYGKLGEKNISSRGFAAKLSESQRKLAYDLGRLNAKNEAEARQKRISEAVSKMAKKRESGALTYDKSVDVSSLREEQKAQADILGKIAEGLGIKVHLFASSEVNGKAYFKAPDGSEVSDNGWYDPETGEIWVDVNAGNSRRGLILITAAHELTHFIKDWSPAKYKVFADFLVKTYNENGKSVDELVRDRMNKSKHDLSYDEAYDEVVARSCESFLMDRDVEMRIAELTNKDKTLAQKIKTFIGQLLAKLKKLAEDLGLAPESEEAKLVAGMTDTLQELHNLWVDALADAGKSYSKSDAKSGNIKFSERDSSEKSKAKITAKLTDAERTEILKNKKIAAPVYKGEADEVISINKKDLESQKLGLVKSALVKIAAEFGAFTDYDIKDVDVKITLSKSNLKESVSKDASPVQLAKLLPLLKESVENAVGIESHHNRYYYDTDTVYFDNLLGAYIDSEELVPVRFGLKHSRNGTTTLYVVVDQNKISLKDLGEIKNDRDRKDAVPDNTGGSSLLSSVTYSIPQIVPFVNSKDLLRYIPDEMLNKVQHSAKWEAIAETITKTNEKNDRKYAEFIEKGDLRSAQHMVDAAAKAAGYDKLFYHGSKKGGGFTKFRDWQYFTENKQYAERYTDRDKKGSLYTTYVKLENPFDTRKAKDRKLFNEIRQEYGLSDIQASGLPDWTDGYDISDYIDENGLDYDGIVLDEGGDLVNGKPVSRGESYVVRKSAQIKSADPVTYDDNGNVIPLSERFNAKNPDIRYSERDTDAITEREVLAEALESAAQNDIERERLKEYKAEIGKYEGLQEELRGVRAEITEIYNSTGKRDTERLRALKDKAAALENNINTYDKKLLRLEAAKPLRNVLKREVESTKYAEKVEARKRESDARLAGRMAQGRIDAETIRKKDEQIKALREQRDRKVAEEKAKSRERIDDIRASGIRAKIKKIRAEIESELQHPTDRRYIPTPLGKAMVKVCELIDIDTPLVKKDGTVNAAQQKRERTKERLSELAAEYENLKHNEDEMLISEHDEQIDAYLKDLRNRYDDVSLNDMSLEELKYFHDVLRSIMGTLRDARKVLGKNDARTLYDYGDSIIAEQKKIKAERGERSDFKKLTDKSLNLSLSPLRNIERMSGYNEKSALVEITRDFEEGVRRKNLFEMRAKKTFEELTTGENEKAYHDAIYKEFGGKIYTDSDGKKFGISKMQMMQAILSYEREQANPSHSHIANGGFTFADLGLLNKGELGAAVSEEDAHSIFGGYALVTEFINKLAGDEWAQAYMKASREFFNGMAKDAINETYLTLKHRILARDKNYIPYEVDKSYVVREITGMDSLQQTINSYGMLQETVKNASQPLIITGLNNMLDRHIDQVGSVYGLAIPIRNFNKIWNISEKRTEGDTEPKKLVKAAVEENWGKDGRESVEQMVMDLQGSRHHERTKLERAIESGYIGSTFALNLSVVTKQIGSLYTANSMLDTQRTSAAMLANLLNTMINFKQLSAEVDKYTAAVYNRREGLSNQEIYTLATQAKKSRVARALNRLPAVINPTKWITFMDASVALSLWKYVKADVKKSTKLEGEALLEATAKRFNDVVENTQSMNDVLHRPEIQKRGDTLSRAFSLFKTDLYQSAGLLRVSLGRYVENKSPENAKAVMRTVASITRSAVWGSLMTTLFALIRYKVNPYRDDEDELTAESWLKRQSIMMMGDIVGFVTPMVGGEIVGFIENILFGETDELIDNLAVSAVNDIYEALLTVADAVREGELPEAKEWDNLFVKAATAFGMPASNVKRTVTAIKLHAEDIANGEFLSFEAGRTKSNTQKLYDAVMRNDAEDIEAARSLFKTESAINSALKQGLRDNDIRVKSAALALRGNDIKSFGAYVKAITSEGRFDGEIVEGAIRAEAKYFNDKLLAGAEALNDGSSEDYRDIVRALRNEYRGVLTQDEIVAAILDYKIEPEEEAVDYEQLQTIYKSSDINAAFDSGDSETALAILRELISVKYENEIAKIKREAEEKGERYVERRAREDAEAAANASLRSSMTSYWKPLYKEAYKRGDSAEMYRIRAILSSSGLYGNASDISKTVKDWLKS